MTIDALLHTLDDLRISPALRGHLLYLHGCGQIDKLVAILGAQAADHEESGCVQIDLETLETSATAPAETWAQEAALRVAQRLRLPKNSAVTVILARCLEEEMDRRDWDRAKESAAGLQPRDEFPDEPPEEV